MPPFQAAKACALLRSPHDDSVVVAPRLVSMCCCKDLKPLRKSVLQVSHMHTHTYHPPTPMVRSMSLHTSRPRRTFLLLESHPHPELREGGGEAVEGGGHPSTCIFSLIHHHDQGSTSPPLPPSLLPSFSLFIPPTSHLLCPPLYPPDPLFSPLFSPYQPKPLLMDRLTD